jgi:hypothetical protein
VDGIVSAASSTCWTFFVHTHVLLGCTEGAAGHSEQHCKGLQRLHTDVFTRHAEDACIKHSKGYVSFPTAGTSAGSGSLLAQYELRLATQ